MRQKYSLILISLTLGVLISYGILITTQSRILFQIVVTVCVLIMATWIVKASVGLLWKYPTIPGFMFIFYTIQIDIPGLIIAIQNSGERSYTLFWQAVQISVFMLSIGIAFANIVFHSNPKELERYFQSPVKLGKANWRLKSLMVLAFPVLLLLVAVYIYRVKEVPLFYMLAHPGDALQISLLRDESFKVLNVPDVELYMYAWIRELILPVMSGTAYIMWLLTRSPNWRDRKSVV